MDARARVASAGLLAAVVLGSCGGSTSYGSVKDVAAALAGQGVDCELDDPDAFVGTEIDGTSQGSCGADGALDDTLDIEVFDEGVMDQVRQEVTAEAREDEGDAVVIGSNWVILADPSPAFQEIGEAIGGEYIE